MRDRRPVPSDRSNSTFEGTEPKLRFGQSFRTSITTSTRSPHKKRAEIIAAVADGEAYMVGGHSEERKGRGGTPRMKAEAKSN